MESFERCRRLRLLEKTEPRKTPKESERKRGRRLLDMEKSLEYKKGSIAMAMGSKTPNSSSVDRYPTGDERSQDYLESRLNIELNLMGTSWDHGDQRGLETRLIAVSLSKN